MSKNTNLPIDKQIKESTELVLQGLEEVLNNILPKFEILSAFLMDNVPLKTELESIREILVPEEDVQKRRYQYFSHNNIYYDLKERRMVKLINFMEEVTINTQDDKTILTHLNTNQSIESLTVDFEKDKHKVISDLVIKVRKSLQLIEDKPKIELTKV